MGNIKGARIRGTIGLATLKVQKLNVINIKAQVQLTIDRYDASGDTFLIFFNIRK